MERKLLTLQHPKLLDQARESAAQGKGFRYDLWSQTLPLQTSGKVFFQWGWCKSSKCTKHYNTILIGLSSSNSNTALYALNAHSIRHIQGAERQKHVFDQKYLWNSLEVRMQWSAESQWLDLPVTRHFLFLSLLHVYKKTKKAPFFPVYCHFSTAPQGFRGRSTAALHILDAFHSPSALNSIRGHCSAFQNLNTLCLSATLISLMNCTGINMGSEYQSHGPNAI